MANPGSPGKMAIKTERDSSHTLWVRIGAPRIWECWGSPPLVARACLPKNMTPLPDGLKAEFGCSILNSMSVHMASPKIWAVGTSI